MSSAIAIPAPPSRSRLLFRFFAGAGAGAAACCIRVPETWDWAGEEAGVSTYVARDGAGRDGACSTTVEVGEGVSTAVLAGAGAGSFAARSTAVRTAAKWGIALPVALAAVNFALDPVFRATLGAPFAARVAVSLALLLPSGFLMGFGFPMGMIRFGDEAKAWYWALNGAFSVLASVLSLAAAMAFGFAAVAYAGAGCYVAAVGLFRWGSGRNR